MYTITKITMSKKKILNDFPYIHLDSVYQVIYNDRTML